MIIVTNFKRFPQEWSASNGIRGRTAAARNVAEFLKYQERADAVFLINCHSKLVLKLALRQLLRFAKHRPIVAVDMVLRKPRGPLSRLAAFAKRLILQRVDLFVHYFRSTDAINDSFGIGGHRARFIEFKANIWEFRSNSPQPEGDYVLCFGRSLRDYDGFFEAITQVALPAVIIDPRDSLARQHGSRFTWPLNQLPPTLRMLRHDSSAASEAAILGGARVVVIPLVSGALVPPISTLMNALAVGKCVIVTDGPGIEAFDGEVLRVPSENPSALADAIKQAWTDTALRVRLSTAGWHHAQECGSEQDFFGRVIDLLAEEFPELAVRLPCA